MLARLSQVNLTRYEPSNHLGIVDGNVRHSDTPELPDEVGQLGSAFFTQKRLEQIIIDNRYWIIYKHNFFMLCLINFEEIPAQRELSPSKAFDKLNNYIIYNRNGSKLVRLLSYQCTRYFWHSKKSYFISEYRWIIDRAYCISVRRKVYHEISLATSVCSSNIPTSPRNLLLCYNA